MKALYYIKTFNKILIALEKAIDMSERHKKDELFEYLRDAVIQRMEYAIEFSWKMIKVILSEYDSIESDSPRQCIQNGFKLGYVNDIEVWVDMLQSRNLTSHTYDEENAQDLYDLRNIYVDKLNNLHETIRKLIKARGNNKKY